MNKFLSSFCWECSGSSMMEINSDSLLPCGWTRCHIDCRQKDIIQRERVPHDYAAHSRIITQYYLPILILAGRLSAGKHHHYHTWMVHAWNMTNMTARILRPHEKSGSCGSMTIMDRKASGCFAGFHGTPNLLVGTTAWAHVPQ